MEAVRVANRDQQRTFRSCGVTWPVPGSRSVGVIECGRATCDERGLVEKEGRSRALLFFSPDPARPAPAFSIDPTDREPGTG